MITDFEVVYIRVIVEPVGLFMLTSILQVLAIQMKLLSMVIQ